MCNHGHGGDGHQHGCGGGCGHGHNHAEEFERTYQGYMAEIREKGLANIARRMGTSLREGALPVTMFGEEFLITDEGMKGEGGREPVFAEKVVLSKYLLLFPENAEEGNEEFVNYRDFKDSAPFVGGFKQNAELPIARDFGGQYGLLKKGCAELDGNDPHLNLGYDLSRVFRALPEVPMLLLFNDSDDEFPACALILFQRKADSYLDMECLAILGWMLASRLASATGVAERALM